MLDWEERENIVLIHGLVWIFSDGAVIIIKPSKILTKEDQLTKDSINAKDTTSTSNIGDKKHTPEKGKSVI